MTVKNVVLLMFNVTLIVITVLLIIVLSDHLNEKKWHREKMWQYEEVYRINEIHKPTLDALGIDEVFYYDWEETANSLDIPVDSLTINAFLKHLLHE